MNDTLICYTPKRFSIAHSDIIRHANIIIEEYATQGFTLTLRQLYYQFVARDLIANTQREYKRLGSIINAARLAGFISWIAIVDRTRNLQSFETWETPEAILEDAARSYLTDKWVEQEYYVEVWIEKDALIGVIEPVCKELEVPYFSCRGYTSQSELWSAAQRLLRAHDHRDQQPVVIHLGDHDPSGIDMTRDITDRLNTFDAMAQVVRIALNMPQIEQYSPPPNPAKITDSRYATYQAEHGEDSWELDALDPLAMSALIRETILQYRDEEAWQKSAALEEEGRARIREVIKHWLQNAEGGAS